MTDEDAITALKGMAMTFRIVNSHVRTNTTWHNDHKMIDTAFVQNSEVFRINCDL